MARIVTIAALFATAGCFGLKEDDGCPDTPRCEQNSVVTCADDGGVAEMPCGKEHRCAADSPVPQCVPIHALPCEPRRTAPHCEAGYIVRCDPEAAYLLPESCGEGRICVGEDPAECRIVTTVRCSPSGWTPLCVDGQRIVCEGSRLAVGGTCSG